MRIIFVLILCLQLICATVTLAQQKPTCQDPTLDFKPEESVTSGTYIKWQPSDCPMVIESWRNGKDCKKIGVTDDKGWNPKKVRPCGGEPTTDVGVNSGGITIEQIRGTQKGRIEIKIWVPNAGIVKSIFINVK